MTDLPMTKAPEESMSEKAEHTPLPWRIGGYCARPTAKLLKGTRIEADRGDGFAFHIAAVGAHPGINADQARANAAIIVRSVNSLPYLVEALEEIVVSFASPRDLKKIAIAALSKYRGEMSKADDAVRDQMIGCLRDADNKLCSDAADEIERLRSQLAAAEKAYAPVEAANTSLLQQKIALEVRLQAMRKALEEIANRAGNHGDPDAADWLPSIEKIADEALRSLTEGAGKC